MKKIVIVSGYFNPLHIGHLNLLKEAKSLGDILVVVVNNDYQVKLKGSFPFMKEKERIEILKSIRYVDNVFLSIDKDKTVRKSLKEVIKKYPDCEYIFANGGDRNISNIPEKPLCEKFNIKMVDNVGGEKVQSSSWLLSKIKNI